MSLVSFYRKRLEGTLLSNSLLHSNGLVSLLLSLANPPFFKRGFKNLSKAINRAENLSNFLLGNQQQEISYIFYF